jgi:hypothetical protein
VRRLLIGCLVLAGCGSGADRTERQDPPPPKPEALWPVPEGYEVHARYARHRLTGRMRLTLRNSGPDPLREVWLRLWPNALGSCKEPLSVVRVTDGGSNGRSRAGCTAQQVRLARDIQPGGSDIISLDFRVDVPPGADRFGRTRDVAYLGNALPTLAVADEDGWRLPPYFDQGEAWFSLAGNWKVSLDVPDGLTVAATGTEVEPGLHRAEKARDFAMAIGRLRTTTDRVGDITVRHFRLPRQPAADARRALRAARAALTSFQRWYGPYGRRELDVVQGPAEIATRGIAMEYPELILTPPSGAAVAHEIAHQWWAFLMGNDPYREPFLDEGFAEYSASRLPRSITGGDRLGSCPRPRRPPRPPLSADAETIRKAGGRAYVRTVYVGSACMLRRLERALGRKRFDAMLKDLVAGYRDQTWTRADLIAAIEKTAPEAFDVDAFLKREGIRRPAS